MFSVEAYHRSWSPRRPLTIMLLFFVVVSLVFTAAPPVSSVVAQTEQPQEHAVSSASGTGTIDFINSMGGAMNAVAVDGSTAYIGEGHALAIFNVSDSSNPLRLARLPLQAIIQDIALVAPYAYITDADNTLHIVNISNPSNPILQSSTTYAPMSSFPRGRIHLVNNLAYIATGEHGLQVLDVSDPAAPTSNGDLLPGYFPNDIVIVENLAYVVTGDITYILDLSDPATPIIGSIVGGNAITIQGNRAYIAGSARGWRGGLFYVLDISTPSTPTEIGTLTVSGVDFEGIAVADGFAYVAGDYGYLHILDIRTPAAPTERGATFIDNYARSVVVTNGRVYIGSAILSTADPDNPTILGRYMTLGDVQDVAIVGNLAYVASGYSGLNIVDISNLANPTIIGSYRTMSLSYASAIDVIGTRAYVVSGGSGGGSLDILDVSDPTAPIVLGNFYSLYEPIRKISVVGSLAYIMMGGLQIIDVSNPAEPTLVGYYNTLWMNDFVIVNNMAYVVGGAGLDIVDINDPTAPLLISNYGGGTYDDPSSMYHISVAANKAYIANSSSPHVIDIIDVSTPTTPVHLGNYNAFFFGASILNDRAFLVDANVFQVLDVSNPAAPSLCASYDTPGNPYGVDVVGDVVYVTDHAGGLQILRYREDSSPISLSITKVMEDLDASNMLFTVDGNTVIAKVTMVNNTVQSLSGQLELIDTLNGTVLSTIPLNTLNAQGTIDVLMPFSTQGMARDSTYTRTPTRGIQAKLVLNNHQPVVSAERRFYVYPRPVVLVHGLASDASTWDSYVDTFLPSINVQGFAVNTLNTGALNTSGLGWSTESIDGNAQRLRDYIASVKFNTGAEKVDLVTHSMGGLIARRYISAYMSEQRPDVNQLIMLGTPNGGSYTAQRAVLGAGVLNSLGWNYPAILELTPSYLWVWNRRNNDRKGVPFYVVAGNYKCNKIKNPFEPSPNDVIVSRQSAFTIPLQGGWTYLSYFQPTCRAEHRSLHIAGDSHSGDSIFNLYVKPLLWGTRPSLPSEVPIAPLRDSTTQWSPLTNSNTPVHAPFEATQVTHVQSNTLHLGGEIEFTSNITAPTTTTFTIIGQPNHLAVTLRDPNGNLITPETEDGSVEYLHFDDGLMPMTAYTLNNPILGVWTIIVTANADTPPEGLSVALLQSSVSSLQLSILDSDTRLVVNSAMTLTAQLHNNTTPVIGADVRASLTIQGEIVNDITLLDDGDHGDGDPHDGVYGYSFIPRTPGLYSVFIQASGENNGSSFTRIASWTVPVEGTRTFLPFVQR